MSNAPLMPMATAVWLVENTTLTFKQIANFCNLHEVEIQGIADGEVAKGIKAYNPIISGQLTRNEINLSSENLAPTTINRKIASVKSFYKYLISREKLKENPFKKITLLKKEKKLPKFIKEKDIKIMFDQSKFENNLTDIRNLLILELLYGTGIRLSELINLKIKDCDLNKNQIKVLGKRNKERIVPINKSIKYQLEKYLILRTEKEINQSEYLIITSKYEKSYPMLIYRIVKENLSKTINSEKYNPHILRHTFATHLVNKGANINAVKDLLGHSSLAATQIYTHNSIEKLKETFKESHPKA